MLQQLQDFIQAGGSSNLSRQQLFSVADLIQMSPDKLTQLAGSLSQQSTETFQCIFTCYFISSLLFLPSFFFFFLNQVIYEEFRHRTEESESSLTAKLFDCIRGIIHKYVIAFHIKMNTNYIMKVSCGVVIVSWFFVFRTYKRRVIPRFYSPCFA